MTILYIVHYIISVSYTHLVREVKLFGILENKRAEFADRQLSVINKQKKMTMLCLLYTSQGKGRNPRKFN